MCAGNQPAQPEEGRDGWDVVFRARLSPAHLSSLCTSLPSSRGAACTWKAVWLNLPKHPLWFPTFSPPFLVFPHPSTPFSQSDVPWCYPSFRYPLCFVVTPGGPITGSSILPSLVGKQGQCWDTFPEGKASTLILRLLVCYLVIGNVCFFSSFPPTWQQASSAFPPSSWGSLPVSVSPEPGSCCGQGAALEGFVLPSFQGDAGPCGVSWEHALTHLPTLARQLGTHHSHWVCPVHLWACPLIFPNTVGFPRVLGLPLTPPCPPFSALSQRDILPCSVLGSSVIFPPPRTQFRSAQWWDGSLIPVSLFCPGCILRSQCLLPKPSQAVLQGHQGPPRCPLKTGFRSGLKIAFATVSRMSLSLSDYLILQFVAHMLD